MTNYNASACANIKIDNKDILNAIKRSMFNNKVNRMQNETCSKNQRTTLSCLT